MTSIHWWVFSALPSDLKPSQFVMISTMLKYTRLQMLSFLFQETTSIQQLPMYEDKLFIYYVINNSAILINFCFNRIYRLITVMWSTWYLLNQHFPVNRIVTVLQSDILNILWMLCTKLMATNSSKHSEVVTKVWN